MVNIIENERSWGIQLISKINQYMAEKSYIIKKASGESGLKCGGKTLFPDVYLFGGKDISNILQGWELKLPDTKITDTELINNAIIKANSLGLDSFLVWNFSIAVLYIKEGDNFSPKKTWDNLKYITNRKEALDVIKSSSYLWENMLTNIINDLNTYFNNGVLIGKPLVDAIDLNLIIDSISDFSINFQKYLKEKSVTNSILEGEINLWWYANKLAYQEKKDDKKWEILTKIIINNWINKIIYAHILKKHYNEALIVENLSNITNVDEAIKIFNEISLKCDFWNIFKNYSIKTENINADLCIPDKILDAFKQFNSFLNDFQINNLSSELIEKLLINAIFQNKRKLAGQFSTPDKLARLLVRSIIEDKTKIVYDGCCGTGTIIKEAYKYKKEGLTDKEALNTIIASDKFSFPIQISNINLSNPENKGRLLQLFKKDIFDVNIGTKFTIYNPDNGKEIIKTIPEVDYFISNLPFIQQEDFQKFNPNVKNNINTKVKSDLQNKYKINGKSDIYAYILIHLYKLISDNGKIGIIVSNSWLSSDWGADFKNVLLSYFKIDKVITSGNGKWFKNADVITNIIILKKRENISDISLDEEISFITLNDKIDNLTDNNINKISTKILLNRVNGNDILINKYSLKEIKNYEKLNIGWNALFSKINFLDYIKDKVIEIDKFFDIQRGEKTGCDQLFYPADKHGIENEFIYKTLKTTKGNKFYDITPNDSTFICGDSIQELTNNDKLGAINWIKKFEHKKKSIPTKKGKEWYDLPCNMKVDFVINVNPDKRIVFYGLDKSSYIGQRGIGLKIKDNMNKDLLHGLLNSILSIFFVEAVGFGRGLGALDLNSTKIQKMKILNPELLTNKQKSNIINKFKKVKEREIQSIDKEFNLDDRIEFDKYILQCYGLENIYDDIKDALTTLFTIRSSVNN